MSCFIDVLGLPDSVNWGLGLAGQYQLTDLNYYEDGVFVGDNGWDDMSFVLDGQADSLFMFGAF